jgi:hypothetical protein
MLGGAGEGLLLFVDNANFLAISEALFIASSKSSCSDIM